jgi:hypothetical protein
METKEDRMNEGRIRVDVEPGMFSTERSVWFQASGRRYSLLVDPSDIIDERYLRVHILGYDNGEAIIDLPRDTFSSGSRVRIPRELLLARDAA